MRKLSILWGILFGCIACNDFLSETPSDELTPESTQSFSELLLYEGYVSKDAVAEKMTAYMDDDIENNYPYSPYSAGYKEEDINNKLFYTWQPNAVNQIISETSGSTYSVTQGYVPWKDYFQYILGCNIILKYVDASVGTEADKNYLKGEAYCLRAYHYFQLVNLYAWPYNDKENDPKTSLGVPIIMSPEIGELSFPRNTVEEVYARIVEDIEQSIVFFEKGKKETTKYRVSVLAAHLLASRIYLYMEQWEKALEHARVVMGQKALCDYTNAPDPYVFWSESEDILWFYGHQDNVWNIPDASKSYSAFVASSRLYALYNADGLTDVRKDYFFEVDNDSLVTVLKYAPSTKAYGQGLRATEAYLNAIEALLELYKAGDAGAGSEALQLLNDFRAKRYVSVDGSVSTGLIMQSADELIKSYRLERRKELCYEGQRWFDLRRFGMPRLEKIWAVDENTNEKYVLKEHDPLYVLDIPSYVTDYNAEIELNEGLSAPRLPENE